MAAPILLAVGLLLGIPLLEQPADRVASGAVLARAEFGPISWGLNERSSPMWQAPSSERWSVTEPWPPLTRSHASDLAAALTARLAEPGSVASLTVRKTRSGAPTLATRIHAGWGAVWFAGLGAALTLRSPLPSAVGLRWARSLRGPPTAIPSI